MEFLRPTTPWTFIPTVALLALLLTPAPVPAEEPPTAETTQTTAAPAAGLLIGRDPVTGALGAPTDEQARELLAAWADKRALDRSGDGLVPFALAGGGSGVFLGGLLQHAAVVHRGADGSFHFGCTDAEHADATAAADPAETAKDADANGWPLQ